MQIPNLEEPQIDIIPANTMWTAILGTIGLLINRYVYPELEYELDDSGKPIVTEAVEEQLKMREPRTWKVATFWAIEK